jgi:hypothetical protein
MNGLGFNVKNFEIKMVNMGSTPQLRNSLRVFAGLFIFLAVCRVSIFFLFLQNPLLADLVMKIPCRLRRG